MTERGRYRCVVKEGPHGDPFLAFEPMTNDVPSMLKGRLVTLDLKPGISLTDAQRLADTIGSSVTGIAIT